MDAVPTRPIPPALPSAYSGWTIDNTQFFEKYGINGGYGIPTSTEIAFAELKAGKSFGVLGRGMKNGVAFSGSSDYDAATDVGETPNKFQTGSTTCIPHFMAVMVAPKDKDTTTMSAITLKLMAKPWGTKIDSMKKPTPPTAAADPDTPTAATGAAKLVSTALALLFLVSYY